MFKADEGLYHFLWKDGQVKVVVSQNLGYWQAIVEVERLMVTSVYLSCISLG